MNLGAEDERAEIGIPGDCNGVNRIIWIPVKPASGEW